MMIDFKTVYVCNIALFVLTYIYPWYDSSNGSNIFKKVSRNFKNI